jgi:gliding motility-associated lipoprotein GldH
MKYIFLSLILVICYGCGTSPVFEGYKNLPKNEWIADSAAVFSFEITDLTNSYDIQATVRNSLRYPYYNLYFSYELVDASGKILATKQTDNNLMNPKTGEPYGVGLGDLYDHDFNLLQRYHFNKVGLYTVRLKQEMRLDTLPEIMAVGIKVTAKP